MLRSMLWSLVKRWYRRVDAYLFNTAGLEKSILEATVAAWNALGEAVKSVVDGIANAFEWFLEWVWKAIEWAISAIVSPIVNAINSWASGLADALTQGFEEYTQGTFNVGKAAERVASALFGSFYCLVKPILEGVKWVTDLIKPVLDVISNAISRATDLIADVALTILAGSNPEATEYKDLFSGDMELEDIQGVIKSQIDEDTSSQWWAFVFGFFSQLFSWSTLRILKG